MKKEIKEKLLSIVQNNYEEIAEDFSQYRSRPMWPEITHLAQKVLNNSSVLDLGCGNGRLLGVWKSKKINYLGIDSSKNLIKIAQEKYPQNDFLIKNLFEIENWKINKKFDYIFLIAVLQHIPSQEERIRMLKSLKNFLKPDGQIIMSNWNLWVSPKHKKLLYKNIFKKIIGQNKMDVGDILFRWRNEKSLRYYHVFTKRELEKLFKKVDLKIEKLYKDDYNYYAVLKN